MRRCTQKLHRWIPNDLHILFKALVPEEEEGRKD